MGISGLLPFVNRACHQASVRDEVPRGGTVAVDGLCWLHRGAYGCAVPLALGDDTNGYITYCIRYARMLRSHGIHVIVVFDGASLPLKRGTEAKRRQDRQRNKALGLKNESEGNAAVAADYFRRSIEITSDMKIKTIQALRKISGVDCLVAPYEADAQLAYLSISGLVDLVVTEDSDLIPFGAKKIMFKMDANGNGDVYKREELPRALGSQPDSFSFTRFRRTCILSGCDYLDSLPGIGLAKASRFFSKTINTDLRRILPKVPSYLRMSSKVTVPAPYVEEFERAERCFLHQVVFDPHSAMRCHLNPLPAGVKSTDLAYAGDLLSKDSNCVVEAAMGNVNPNRLTEIVDTFNPDLPFPATGHMALSPRSIWRSSSRPGSLSKRPAQTSAFSVSPVKKRRVQKSILNDEQSKARESRIGAMPIEKELLFLYGCDIATGSRRQSALETSDSQELSTRSDLLLSRYFSSPAAGDSNTDEPRCSGIMRSRSKPRDEFCETRDFASAVFIERNHAREQLPDRYFCGFEDDDKTGHVATPTERLTMSSCSTTEQLRNDGCPRLKSVKSHIERFDSAIDEPTRPLGSGNSDYHDGGAGECNSVHFKFLGEGVDDAKKSDGTPNRSSLHHNPFATAVSSLTPSSSSGTSSQVRSRQRSPQQTRRLSGCQVVGPTPVKAKSHGIIADIAHDIEREMKRRTLVSPSRFRSSGHRPSVLTGADDEEPVQGNDSATRFSLAKSGHNSRSDDEVSPSLLVRVSSSKSSGATVSNHVTRSLLSSTEGRGEVSRVSDAGSSKRLNPCSDAMADAGEVIATNVSSATEVIDISASPSKKRIAGKIGRGSKPVGKCKRPGLKRKPLHAASPVNQPGIVDLWSRFAFKPKA